MDPLTSFSSPVSPVNPIPASNDPAASIKITLIDIIKKMGSERAQVKGWDLVKEQKSGKEVIAAAKVFHELFPDAKNDKVTFEFSDGSTLELSSSLVEALKKDSQTISDLLSDVEGMLKNRWVQSPCRKP